MESTFFIKFSKSFEILFLSTFFVEGHVIINMSSTLISTPPQFLFGLQHEFSNHPRAHAKVFSTWKLRSKEYWDSMMPLTEFINGDGDVVTAARRASIYKTFFVELGVVSLHIVLYMNVPAPTMNNTPTPEKD